ncbi:hypothetical protein WJX82_004696 [Trebouxia sp. C0006]
MEVCPYSAKYERPKNAEERFLGSGGVSDLVERCRAIGSEKFVAVKRLSEDTDDLYNSEARMLLQANYHDVPGVVRLVTGHTLWVESQLPPVSNQMVNSREARMLPVAAELLQTLQDLHSKAGIAHLDLTSNNLMLRADGGLWDHIRLIDFGFAQTCKSDPTVTDILPVGATLYFGSPEQLRSLQLQLEGCYDQSAKINGPACDLWSAGIVLYFLMTGELPFEPKGSPRRAPRYLSKADGELWQGYEAMGAVHNTWEKSVHSAETAGIPVSHPIIDKIRACSSTPDLAADFFLCLLRSEASNRATAVSIVTHPYCHLQCHEAHVAFLQRLIEEKDAKIRAAEVDDDESSLVFGFPGAPGGSDGDVGGGGGGDTASGGRAQLKASSPPPASVKSRSSISAWWKRSVTKMKTISRGIATNSINLI